MKVNGKSKTPITAAQSKKSGDVSKQTNGKPGGTKARASQQPTKNKNNGVKLAVLERISDGILAFDAGMNYTYLNERAGQLLGRSADELVGKNLGEEFAGAGQPPFLEACQRALETQSVVWLNEYFPPTDRWLEGRVYPSTEGVSVLFTEGPSQKAEEVEDRYQILVDSMQEAFLLADVLTDENGEPRQFRFLDINAAMERFLGKSRSEVIGHTMREILHLDERETTLETRIARVGYGGEPFFVEEFSHSLQRWYRAHFFSPRPGQVAGLAFDITESKQVEERIREVSMFPQQNPNPVMRLRRNGEVLYSNPASAPLLAAWKRTGGQARSFLDIQELLSQILETGSNREIEVENEGRVFNCLLVPIQEMDYVNLYFRDITENKQAEEALRALVNQASAGIVRTDMQGRFTFVNEALCQMLGYTPAELTGMTIWEITDPQILEKNKLLFKRLLSAGEGYHLEKRLIRRNGSMMWASVGVSPVREVDGQIRGISAVIVDISRRKHAEESLLDNARRSLFLSSLSDTINALDAPAKIQVEAACLLGAHLKASRVMYIELEEDHTALVQGGYVDGVPALEGSFSLEDFTPQDQLSRLQSGRPLVVTDVENDPRLTASQKRTYASRSIQAHILLPLTREGKLTAVCSIQQAQPRSWKAEEISVMEESAGRIRTSIERAQAEERLRDSEKRFRILANAVPSIVWSSAPDGRLLYVNDRWYEFTGLPRRGDMPLWSDLVIHPEDSGTFMREMQIAKTSQVETVFEIRIRRHDGVYRWFQTRSVPTVDEDGNVTTWHGVLTDIHERVEREANLRQLIDSTPFILTRSDRDLRYRFVSQAAAKMLGIPAAEAEGRPLREVLGESTFNASLPYMEQVLQGNRVSFETSITRPGADDIFVQAHYVPDINEQGEVVGWFASIVDITEQKRADKELRESEQKFNIIFNKLPFAAVLLRPGDGVIVDINEEYETVFGYTRQNAIGRTPFELGIDSSPSDRAHILAELQSMVSIRDMEIELETKPHGPRIFLINTDMVNISGRKYILQTAQDITERKQAEAARRASEERYRRIVETANEGIWEIDENTKTIFANARMAEMLGYTAEEMIGRSSFDFIFPEDEQDGQQRMAHAQHGQPVRSSEFKFRRKDGSILWTLVSTSPQLDTNGNFLGSIAMIMDITGRKQAEEMLRRSEERMRLAIETNRMVAWEWDRTKDRVTTSANLPDIYGLPEVNTSTEGFALIWPEDLPAHNEKVESVLRHGGEYRSEFRITRPVDGRMAWMEERATAITDAEGQVTRLLGIVTDISERKRADQNLAEFARQQQALYRLADEMNRAASLEELFEPALHAILSALQCDRASILLFDEKEVMRFVAWRGLSDAYRRATDGHSPWKSGERHAKPIGMDDVAAADLTDSLRATIQAEGIGALAFIPLIFNETLIGKFMVYYNRPHPFNETDIELSQTIAHQLAASIERKRATDQLRLSRQRLALTYTHAPIGIVETSLEGRYVEVNDAICKMLGYTYDELCGMGIAEVTHPDDMEADLALYRQLVRGEIPFYRAEKRYIRKDGSVLWGEVVRALVHDEEGKPLYGIGAILNVTERKQREEELRARTEEFETLMEVSPIGIFMAFDPACIHITGNPAGYRLVEMPEESSVNISKSAPEHERPTYRTFRDGVELKPEELPMQAAARLGMEVEEETLELRFENGAQKYIYAYAKPLFDANGSVRGAIAAMLDITQRRQKEEELRARTEEIETLMQVSPIGIMVAHDPECSVISGNPAANQILGLSQDSEENLSNPVLAEKGPAHRVYRDGVELAVSDLPMQVSARLGIEVKDEMLELRFEDGTQKYIYLYSKPLFDPQNRSRGAIAAILDVTEHRRNEQALRESEERFSKAFRVSPDAVIISRMVDGMIMDVNNSWVTLFGYETEEVIGRTSLELNLFANPEERKRVVELLQEHGYVREYGIDIRRKSGELRHVLLAVEGIEINGQDCLISILHDVTERRQAEETLRQSEERFARFMLHLPGLAWIKDMQGRYVFANIAAQKAFNTPQDRLYGKTDWDIFPEKIAAQFKANDDQAILDEKGVQVVEALQQDDGILHHSLVTKFPIPGPDGRPQWIGGTAFDITERVEMEDALREARAQAEKTAYRMTQLQKVTAALSQVTTPMQVAQVVVEQGARVLGAAASTMLALDEEEKALNMLYSSLKEPGRQMFTRLLLSQKAPHTDVIRSGQPIWLASREDYLERYPDLADMIQVWDYQAAIVVPLQYKGRTHGTLSMSFDRVIPFSMEDQEYLLTLGRQAAQALERAHVENALRLDATMMENVSAGIYLVRASDETIIHTNPRFDTLFGYAAGEVYGKHVSAINAPSRLSAEEVAEEIIAALGKENYWQGEVLSLRKDGTNFWAFDSMTTYEHPSYGTVWVAARQDISAQKKVEEALRQSEQRYRAIVSQATAGIVRKDAMGRLLFVNQAFCDMLGMTEDELAGRQIWELTHEEDVVENKRLYHRLLAEATPFKLEKRLIRKDGSILWTSVSVSPVIDEDGQTNSAVSVYVDVTRRRQAERRLALLAIVSELTREYDEPDELFYAVSRVTGEHFQARRSLFNEIDLEHDREIVHRDYCRGVDSVAGVHAISEYSSITTAEMMDGKTVVNRDSSLDPRTAADYERSYVEHGERAYVAVPLLREERWVASLWISDDKPREWDMDDIYLLEAIAERTWTAAEKIRVDRALRESEERLRVTFNTTVVGFATLTPDTHFLDVNDAFCQIVGYQRAELLEIHYEGLTHPDFSEETRQQIGQLLSGEIPSFTIEKIFIRRDGTEIWVQNSLSLVQDADGNPSHLIVICQDVTERKRSEKALLESNQRYQTLVEISPYAIFVNKDGRIVFANNECLKLLGADSPDQILGKSNFDILHPDYHDAVGERNKLMMEGQPVPSLEEKIIRLDGEIVDVETSASPFIEKGEPAILVTMNDITERKRAEEALHQLNLELEERVRRRTIELQTANEFLRESEATSRLILESMPDAIVIIDKDGRIVHANTQVNTLFGYSPQEVLGQPVESLVPQRLHEKHMQLRSSYDQLPSRRIMGLGQDLHGRRKDESEFPVEVMLAPIDNSTNWDILVAIRDNTKQRDAQEALRANEEKLRTLFEILPVGISFLGKDGRINELNNALTEIMDLTRAELLMGKHGNRRYIRADGSPMPPSEFASSRARTEHKTINNVETGIVKESGEVIWTSVNAAPVQIADVEAAIVTIDITERKQAEEALHKHRERLRQLSRRLVEVQEEERHAIAQELHDRVGQNLAALTLNLNILRNQLSSEVLDKVGTRLNDSVTLVKDILTITRSVMADLRPDVLDDYGLDAAIMEHAERFMQRYGIRVITHIPGKTPLRLERGIEMTLLRIAQEALKNVALHSQASQAVIALEMEGDAILMTIEDNGLGILSWQKVNQPGSHGLRIMRERAEAFGGYLKVHSTYKNGTKIEVKIPLGNSGSSVSKERKS